MFNQTFVDGVGKTNKSWTVALSFLMQMVVVAVLIIIPLIYTDVLPRAQLVSLLQAPAPPPPPPPPPPPTPVKVVKVAPRQFDAGKLTAPKEIPKQVAIIKEEELPPSTANVQVTSGLAPSILSTGGGIGIPTFAPPPPPPPPPVKEAPKENKPVPLGGKVVEGLLLKKVLPIYPQTAKAMRQQGTVKFTAVISKDGKVENLTYVSGPALLVQSAKDAVAQWVYKPYTLNGETVPVITEILVIYQLNAN